MGQIFESATRKRRILAKVYASQFIKNSDPFSYLESSLETDRTGLLGELKILEQENLVTINGNLLKLTPSGRKEIVAVMAGGAFDIIHPGHIETLEQARALGDALIVSVARDKTFEKNKKRKPLHGEALRQKLVFSLKPVDAAVLGSEEDIIETVVLIQPDVIALGYDQAENEIAILDQISKRGFRNVKLVRLMSSVPGIKTTSILKSQAAKTT
ncbi:MAG: adenylyltransferase/cytidyltransferase family protein [Nitrososphaerales archaeon]